MAQQTIDITKSTPGNPLDMEALYRAADDTNRRTRRRERRGQDDVYLTPDEETSTRLFNRLITSRHGSQHTYYERHLARHRHNRLKRGAAHYTPLEVTSAIRFRLEYWARRGRLFKVPIHTDNFGDAVLNAWRTLNNIPITEAQLGRRP